jgi:hypothetical protein
VSARPEKALNAKTPVFAVQPRRRRNLDKKEALCASGHEAHTNTARRRSGSPAHAQVNAAIMKSGDRLSAIATTHPNLD